MNREHRIICRKCKVVLTLSDFAGFSARPRCIECGSKFYGVVDGRGDLDLGQLCHEMAEVECKDIEVKFIRMSPHTWHKVSTAHRKIKLDGLFIWGDKKVMMEDVVFIWDEKKA